MRDVLANVGASLVGGHTQITPVVNQQLGPVPVEGAAVLAVEHRGLLDGVDPSTVRAAAATVDDPGISVVETALAAAELSATALHDPTEGGLAAGLDELAARDEVAVIVDRGRILWFSPVSRCARRWGRTRGRPSHPGR
jgi:hydrogenase maturation factor